MRYERSEGAEPSGIAARTSLSSFQTPRVRTEPAADDLLKTIKNVSKQQFLGRALSSASSCNELWLFEHELNSYKQQYSSSVELLQRYRDLDSFRCVSGADHGICIADSQHECMFV